MIINNITDLQTVFFNDSYFMTLQKNNNINIYFYRFDEKLKLALAINVAGTMEMIKLAKEMEHLKVFKLNAVDKFT